MSGDEQRPKCFIAMPVTTHPDEAAAYDDPAHWLHVMETLFVPAIEDAGFTPVRPIAQGSDLIHAGIIRHLSEVDLVLCDLSGHNPNVFFELGVRTALNKPIALIRDERTDLPFDTSVVNTLEYQSSLRGWDIAAQRASLSEHINSCANSCAGENPMWRQFGIRIAATAPSTDQSTEDARLDYLISEVADLRNDVSREIATLRNTVAHVGQDPRVLNASLGQTTDRHRDLRLSESRRTSNALRDIAGAGIPGLIEVVETEPGTVTVTFTSSPDEFPFKIVAALAESWDVRVHFVHDPHA